VVPKVTTITQEQKVFSVTSSAYFTLGLRLVNNYYVLSLSCRTFLRNWFMTRLTGCKMVTVEDIAELESVNGTRWCDLSRNLFKVSTFSAISLL